MHLRHAVRLLLCKRCSCAKKWRPLSLAISLAIRFPLFQSSNPKRGSYSLLYKSCRAKNIVVQKNGYGVATIIRLLKIIFLFCKRVFCTRTLSKRLYSAKETYEIKEPTNRSHSKSYRSFSTKEPLNIGHFCRKWPIKIRDPMSLRHPLRVASLQFADEKRGN